VILLSAENGSYGHGHGHRRRRTSDAGSDSRTGGDLYFARCVPYRKGQLCWSERRTGLEVRASAFNKSISARMHHAYAPLQMD
jgi:hypothetical protein